MIQQQQHSVGIVAGLVLVTSTVVMSNSLAPLSRMLLLSGVFMFLTFVVFIAYGLAAAAVRRHLLVRPSVLAWMRRAFAAAFVALGAKLALSER